MNGREKREVCFGRKPAFGMHDVVKEGGASPSWTGSGGLSTQWIGETESFSPFVAAEPVRQSRLPLPPPSVSSPDEGRGSISRADHPSVDRPRRRPPQDMNFNEAGKAKRGGGVSLRITL